mgnify:CR=1 FL=1
MKAIVALGMTMFLTAETIGQERQDISPEAAATARTLMETALESDLAYDIVESLTTEIGPRLAGSEAEERARAWGAALGQELGFDRVEVEGFTMPFWDRDSLSITMTAPYEMELHGTALGGSGSGSVQSEIVYFRTVDDLVAAEDGSLEGRIAFIDGDIMSFQDGMQGFFTEAGVSPLAAESILLFITFMPLMVAVGIISIALREICTYQAYQLNVKRIKMQVKMQELKAKREEIRNDDSKTDEEKADELSQLGHKAQAWEDEEHPGMNRSAERWFRRSHLGIPEPPPPPEPEWRKAYRAHMAEREQERAAREAAKSPAERAAEAAAAAAARARLDEENARREAEIKAELEAVEKESKELKLRRDQLVVKLRKAKAAGIVKNIGFSAHNEDVACQLIATENLSQIHVAHRRERPS